MNGSKKITWEAADHIKVEKSTDWFWVIGIIAIGIAVLSIYFNNLLFALLILIGTFALFIQSHSEPYMQKYEINRKGVVIGDILYPYSSLESFWVIDEDGWDRDRMLVKSTKLFMPMIVMPLGEDVTPDDIRDYMLEYLDEEQMEESAIEKIVILLGF